jgi:hypothetical protein
VRLDGESDFGPLRLGLAPNSAILGRVVSGSGEAAANTSMSVFRVVSGPTERILRTHSTAIVADDQGSYRIGGLPPGRYMVSALGGFYSYYAQPQPSVDDVNRALERLEREGPSPAGDLTLEGVRASLTGFARTFLGDGTLTGADIVEVGVAETITVADIVLKPLRPAVLKGVVLGSDGSRLSATLDPLGYTTDSTFSRTVQVSADGRFSFGDVAPGEYIVRARGESLTPNSERTALVGATRITAISGGEAQILVAVGRGGSVVGVIRIPVGVSPTPRLRLVGIEGDASGLTSPVLTHQGRVEVQGLFPGRYQLVPQHDSGTGGDVWSVRVTGQAVQQDGSIEVAAGSTHTIEVELIRAAASRVVR